MIVLKTDIVGLKKIMVEEKMDKKVDLANASGIDRNTLGKILTGKIQPSSSVMDKLVSTLHIEPEVAGTIFFTHDLPEK